MESQGGGDDVRLLVEREFAEERLRERIEAKGRSSEFVREPAEGKPGLCGIGLRAGKEGVVVSLEVDDHDGAILEANHLRQDQRNSEQSFSRAGVSEQVGMFLEDAAGDEHGGVVRSVHAQEQTLLFGRVVGGLDPLDQVVPSFRGQQVLRVEVVGRTETADDAAGGGKAKPGEQAHGENRRERGRQQEFSEQDQIAAKDGNLFVAEFFDPLWQAFG